MLGLVILIIMVLGTSTLAHLRISNLILAATLSSVGSFVLFVIVGYFVEGYVDPFWPVAAVVAIPPAFGGSIVIGLLVRSIRRSWGHHT